MNASTRRQFLLFGTIGVIGFVVDASVLAVAMRFAGLGFYSGRILSYLCAATVTWACNRQFTFKTQDSRRIFHQWIAFLGVNTVGGAINYGVYSVLIANLAIVAANPVLGVAVGSLSGLTTNFLLSRRLVFGGKSTATR